MAFLTFAKALTCLENPIKIILEANANNQVTRGLRVLEFLQIACASHELVPIYFGLSASRAFDLNAYELTALFGNKIISVAIL
jgi:hypothetical protein